MGDISYFLILTYWLSHIISIILNRYIRKEGILLVRTGRPTNNPKRNRMEVRLSDEDINYLKIIRLGIKLVYEKEK